MSQISMFGCEMCEVWKKNGEYNEMIKKYTAID